MGVRGRGGQRSYRDRVGFIDLELGGLVVAVGCPRRQQVEEGGQQVHVLPADVGDLEDGADPAGGGGGVTGAHISPPVRWSSQHIAAGVRAKG